MYYKFNPTRSSMTDPHFEELPFENFDPFPHFENSENSEKSFHHFENSENSEKSFQNFETSEKSFHHFQNSKPPTASSRLSTSTRKENQIQLILENILTRLSVDRPTHDEVLGQ